MRPFLGAHGVDCSDHCDDPVTLRSALRPLMAVDQFGAGRVES
jgi:hypothetical protein